MSFGMYARNVIAGQGRYIADKAPETKEPTVNDNIPTGPALDLMEQLGGSFSRAIAQAYYCADTHNRQRLIAAFGELFAKYNAMAKERPDALAP